MANSYTVLDSTGATRTFKATDIAPTVSPDVPGLLVPNSIPTDDTGSAFKASNPLPVVTAASASVTGQASVARVKSASSTNATSVKASPGNVFGFTLYNNASSDRFFKFYDKASSPSVGSDTPLFTVPLPAKGGITFEPTFAIKFATGIAYAITSGITDGDSGAITADDIHGALFWL